MRKAIAVDRLSGVHADFNLHAALLKQRKQRAMHGLRIGKQHDDAIERFMRDAARFHGIAERFVAIHNSGAKQQFFANRFKLDERVPTLLQRRSPRESPPPQPLRASALWGSG